MSRRARSFLAIKGAISVALLVGLVHHIAAREGMTALGRRLSALDWLAVLAAVGLHFAAVLAGVARWRLLLEARGLGQPFAWLLRSFLIGRFVGAFTPSTTGLDGWRGYEVARRTGDVAGSAGVIVVEKLIGMVGMALVCAALAPAGVLEPLGPAALPSATALATVAALGIFALARPRRAAALARIAPAALRGRAEKIAQALAAGALTPGRLALALLLGVASHLALSAVFAATGAALGVAAPLGTLLAVGNAIVLAVLLPISIGGVGVREGVAVALLAGAGVGAADAVLVALLGYLTGQIPALAGGLLLVVDRGAPRLSEVAPPGAVPADRAG